MRDGSDGAALLAVVHYYCPEHMRLDGECGAALAAHAGQTAGRDLGPSEPPGRLHVGGDGEGDALSPKLHLARRRSGTGGSWVMRQRFATRAASVSGRLGLCQSCCGRFETPGTSFGAGNEGRMRPVDWPLVTVLLSDAGTSLRGARSPTVGRGCGRGHEQRRPVPTATSVQRPWERESRFGFC